MTPIGADYREDGTTHFRVWAPEHRSVTVVFEAEIARFSLRREGNGYFSGPHKQSGPGTNYKFQLDGGEAFPDPASQFQPSGPHGYSQVVDPRSFRWTDENWPGTKLEGQVIYEMHLGTFTPEGTWVGAEKKLEY